MILECPSCRTRYLVQIGLFAQGGRQVRCAQCKHEWHAKLPTTIDVVTPWPDFSPPTPAPPPPISRSWNSPMFRTETKPPESASKPEVVPNLPAVIKNWHLQKTLLRLAGYMVLACALVAWPISARQPIVKVFPGLRGLYDFVGLHVAPAWEGLMFTQVKSELKYDSGTMKLYVDGVIHNSTPEVQLIPDIKARARGPDRRIIQSWWVQSPAATIDAEGDVPFHTEVASPMEHTIEDVYLEFYSRDEKTDVGK